ncbi:DNA repair protein rad2 [Entomortierella chlamydospora]|uniref:DNA repair protein rad2 n=1 Tax=Entomortierella chlamydospora TaxID=101097 RepID=A0A9P6T1I9_9FUNG|nr:DNA repair protein rad2 [Entomortierella chlamydospora]
MGVKGLWELLHPVARPIKLENLSNKHLAIDASIWLHQFLRGMRDKEGQVISNAHIIGFFRRICKLLYYNIKPIFVFDGGTPALKRLTIQERRRRKKQDANMVKRTAERLLAAQLRLHALEQRKAARKKKAVEENSLAGVVHDSDENPKYLDEIESDVPQAGNTDSQTDSKTNDGTAVGSQAKRIKDKYLLPPMEVDFETLSKIRSNDERFGYQPEDEVGHFLDGLKKESGLANIDSDVFKALPSEMQYEILQDIRHRSRVTSYERVQEMVRLSNTPMDFSKLQVQGVIRRHNVTHKLLTVNQTVSRIESTVKPGRIASQRNRQYILVKNEEGGWVLGGKKPTTGNTADKPVQLDSDDDEIKPENEIKEEEGEDLDSDEDIELEEVTIPLITSSPATDNSFKSDVEVKPMPAQLATPKPTPKPTPKVDESNLLINHLEAYMDEDESIEKVMAKFAEIEDQAARKGGSGVAPLPTTDRNYEEDSTNRKNGLHLIRESDVIHVQDGARQHLAKAGLRLKSDPQWPEVISDDEEMASLDTLYSLDTLHSDNTVDYDDFEDMVEDEETGEIISRGAYNRRYQRQISPEASIGRALSIVEESNLQLEAFHSYWTGYTPDFFKVKNQDYEQMIKDAIYDWDDDRVEAEVRSATRKLEKSSVNDILGVEALNFWKSFLESLLNRRQVQLNSASQPVVVDLDEPEPQTGKSLPTKERKSRLSQLISLDDDDDDIVFDAKETYKDRLLQQQAAPVELEVEKSTPIHVTSLKSTSDDSTLSRRPILDFSSSIELERPNVPVSVESTPTKPALSTSDSPTRLNLVVSDDEGTELGAVIDASTSDSGAGSLISSSRPDSEVAVVPSFDKGFDHVSGDEIDHPTTEDSIMLDQDSGESHVEAIPDDEGDGEDEDEDEEDDVDEADLETEEQGFTNLFPDMATLPGAILNAKELEQEPSFSKEERAILEQQEAKKMFEESRQLESEIKVLRDQHRKHQRDADDLTESMVAETQTLLRLFGIPYLVAPMEAEAQCADLQLRGVVDGILTEDSDVFLFGGARVFKNMFKEEKFVECYLMSDIERDLGVGRERLVALAYLLGSDYTTGIKGVGLVTAMEIIRLFPKLESFARWWRGEQQKANGSGEKDNENTVGLTEMELDSIDEVALEKLAKQCKKIHMPSTFPDPHIFDAYVRPLVDDDPAKFQWGIPDLDGLRDFLRKSLGWDRGEVDRVLLPIIRQMSSTENQMQTTLDGFFDVSAGMGSFQPLPKNNLYKSARLRKVVDGLKGQNSGNQSGGEGPESDGDKDGAATTATKKKTAAKRKLATKKAKETSNATEGDIDVTDVGAQAGVENDDEDDEEGFLDELEFKKRKTSRTSSLKKTRVAQTKVPEAVTAAKQNLKSKDVHLKLAARNKDRAAAAAEDDQSKNSKQAKRDDTDRNGTSDSDSSDDDEKDQDDLAPSHWDLLAERQRQQQLEQQQSPRKGNGPSGPTVTSSSIVSGRASSLTAIVSASNAARYGSGSFRNKETGTTGSQKKPSAKKQ